jgi:lipopolysaccharide/colanic/teichoic acid biosynthesis glycosyltransferase
VKGSFYLRKGKRMIDVVGAAGALIVTAPVQLLAAAVVRRQMGTPVIFRQKRPGLDGRPFTLLKFRTMVNTLDGSGAIGSDADRLTALGRRLRASSIDELPELWNVIRGDMSLVGPRPLLMEYLPRYSPEQACRHEVRPGITGWAQVNGRNALTWEEKFELDVWYVENLTFGLDARILWRTVVTVFTRGGIAADGHATAPEFKPLPPGAQP